VRMYEVYRNDAAFDVHRSGPSLARFCQETAGIARSTIIESQIELTNARSATSASLRDVAERRRMLAMANHRHKRRSADRGWNSSDR
jgi:hypothetical protein